MKSLCSSLVTLTLTALIGFSLLASPVHAAETSSPWSAPSLDMFVGAIGKTVSGGVNKEGAESNSFFSNAYTIGCVIMGCAADPTHPFSYNRSAVSGMGSAIAGLYKNPPASSYEFAMDMGETLGFIPKQTYAQGVGFAGLRPLLGVWKVFRNIAYGIIAIIIVIVGFMVMLRTKIDPKTVVSVQNAIPKIVFALILVTFSYAIVGFLIDIMYVCMLLITSMLIGPYSELYGRFAAVLNVGLPTSTVLKLLPVTPDSFVTSDFLTVSSIFFQGGVWSWWNILKLFPWWGHAAASGVGAAIGFLFTGLGLKGAIFGAFAPQVIVLLIIALAVIMGLVRLFFLLLDSYINIIVALIISPLQLMLEAVPGVDAFGSWIKNLISKLLVFPTTAALLLVTFYLVTLGDSSGLWAPPFISGEGPSAPGLSGLIGLGMLLSIPTIVGSLQKLLKAEPVVPAGIGPILGPMTSGMGQLINLYYQFSMIKAYSRKEHAPSPYTQAIGAGNQNLGSILKGGGGGESH
ncbi:hypothetical protein HY949_00195 [Candidatus Gottesmanbacteria bacterium]|nr:hypothetical protein [Candidatus Gottesmanbacteria bacterium]